MVFSRHPEYPDLQKTDIQRMPLVVPEYGAVPLYLTLESKFVDRSEIRAQQHPDAFPAGLTVLSGRAYLSLAAKSNDENQRGVDESSEPFARKNNIGSVLCSLRPRSFRRPVVCIEDIQTDEFSQSAQPALLRTYIAACLLSHTVQLCDPRSLIEIPAAATRETHDVFKHAGIHPDISTGGFERHNDTYVSSVITICSNKIDDITRFVSTTQT